MELHSHSHRLEPRAPDWTAAAVSGFAAGTFHFDLSVGMGLLVGAVFGLAMYLLNFYAIARYFPWFADLRGWMTMAAHLIFGMTAAIMYRKLERQDLLG